MNVDILTVNADIDNDLMKQVMAINPSTVAERLVLVLETHGGSPFVAYRCMQHLAALYSTVEAVIPDKAMSAGTLMALGADKIYMYQGSCLGPLDLQISHPKDGNQISAIDVQQSIYTIFGLTETMTETLFNQSSGTFGLSKEAAVKLAQQSAVKLLQPIVDKIDPYHLNASTRNASIGQKYARILLMSRMMKGNFSQAGETAKLLATGYEMHSYAITLEEARDYLGLNVEEITEAVLSEAVISRLKNLPEGVKVEQIRTAATSAPKTRAQNQGGTDDK